MKFFTFLLALFASIVIIDAQTSAPTECSDEMEIMLVMDHSGSIGKIPNGFQLIQQFIIDIADGVLMGPDNVRFAMRGFSTDTFHNFYFDSRKGEIFNDFVEYVEDMTLVGGLTATGEGLKQTRLDECADSRRRAGVQTIVLLITDGKPNRPDDFGPAEVYSIEECLALNEMSDDVLVIPVGVGEGVDEALLEKWADPLIGGGDGRYLLIESFDDLQSSAAEVINLISACIYTDVPTAAPTTGDCTKQVDLYFVVDESSSIGEDDYDEVISFISAVVESPEFVFGTGEDESRLGLVMFNQKLTSIVEYGQEASTDVDEFVTKLEAHTFTGGVTATGRGLAWAKDNGMMDDERMEDGDREDVEGYVILITDGNPNRPQPKSRAKGRCTGQADQLMAMDNVEVIGMGIGKQLKRPYMRSITDKSYFVNEFEDLNVYVDTLVAYITGCPIGGE